MIKSSWILLKKTIKLISPLIFAYPLLYERPVILNDFRRSRRCSDWRGFTVLHFNILGRMIHKYFNFLQFILLCRYIPIYVHCSNRYFSILYYSTSIASVGVVEVFFLVVIINYIISHIIDCDA